MPAKTQTALTLSTIFTIAPRVIAADTSITLPAPGGQQQVVDAGATGIRLTVNVALADKLATGKTVDVKSYLSADNGATWDFVNGTFWTSYGPNGLSFTDFSGNTITNPDPTLFVPLNGRSGNLIRAVFAIGPSLTAGLTIEKF